MAVFLEQDNKINLTNDTNVWTDPYVHCIKIHIHLLA